MRLMSLISQTPPARTTHSSVTPLMSSSNEYVPPGYVPNFNPRSSLFMITGSSEPGMDWLTPTGELRREKMGGALSVAPFEAGAMKLAMAQVQGVFQIGFMLWMTGSQLTLFSMLFLMQALAPMYNILRLNAGEAFYLPSLLKLSLHVFVCAAGLDLF